MQGPALSTTGRLLGWLALVVEISAFVILAVEAQRQGSSWLWLQVNLVGGVLALAALILAWRANPAGACKRPAMAALIVMALPFVLWILLYALLILFSHDS